MRKAGKIALYALMALTVLASGGLGVLQTGLGKAWLAGEMTALASAPGGTVKIGVLSGFVPFDIRIDRIAVADEAGPWLAIDQAALAWSPTALLRGRLKIDRLTADRIAATRLPAAEPGPPGQSAGFALPRLPVGIEIDNFAVARVVAGPALGAGQDAAASVSAHGMLGRDRADLSVRLTRVDGQPGSGALDAHYDQSANALDLDVDLEEPTGILMDAALGRTDRLPLRATLKGGGKLDDWKGRLVVAARDAIDVDTAIAFDHTAGSRIALDGSVAVSSLLPDNARGLVGDRISFDIVAAESGKNALMLAPSRIAFGGAVVAFEGGQTESGALSGKLTLTIPDAATLDPLIGMAAEGGLTLNAVLSGAADHPQLALTERGRLAFGRIAIDGATLDAKVDRDPRGKGDNPIFALTIDGAVPDMRDALTGQLYGAVSLHAAGTTDAKGSLIELGALTASGAGIDLSGRGDFEDGRASGAAALKADDLSVIGKIAGQDLRGAATLDLTIATAADGAVTVQARAAGDKVQTGIPAADALLAGPLTLDAAGARAADGAVRLDRLVLASARARIAGAAAFNPTDRTLTANLQATLADIAALSGALSSPLSGKGAVSAKIGGTLDAPSIDADAALDRLAIGAFRVDHLDARIQAPQGLNGAAAVNVQIASGRLNETIDVALDRPGPQSYRLNRLRLAGTGGAAAGALTVDLGSARVSGRLDAKIADLSVWSGVAGRPLAGQIALDFDLPNAAGRQGPVRLTIDRLALGENAGSIGIGRAVLDGRASGDWGKPNGVIDLMLNGGAAGGVSIASADAHIAAQGTKADFRIGGAGQAGDKFSMSAAGSIDRGRGATTLVLASLAAGIGSNTLALTRPATISVAPGAFQVAGLSLALDRGAPDGGGTLEGDGAFSPSKVSANLRLRQLPLHPLALLVGRRFVAGALDGTLTLAGSAQHPNAEMTLATKGLDLETDGPLPRPALDLAASADWRGERARVTVKIGTGTGEALNLTGSVPFAFDLTKFTPRQSSDSALALQLSGGGKLENLSSIMPLGEDRLSGAFAVDVAIGGTIAAPIPTGRVAVTGGRYANMALGTEIDGIDLLVTGAGQRFVLDHLTATDGATGSLTASGAVDLAAKPVTVGLDLGLTDFRVAHGDDATVNADGQMSLAGTAAAMKASGALTIRRAELYIPDRLPASVANLDVIEIGGGRNAASTTIAAAPKEAPLAPIALQVTLDAPGQVFVRGHGLTSEWRAHMDITGTTAAPSVVGQLSVLNGSLDLLGQSFNLDRGAVSFGGTDLNPALDVQASASASGVTALVNVTGTAAAPKIALSSTPILPQDEILSRVLFGENVASLTASQGLQLAAAAASLAQGGPGIIDRVRSKIGLDRLDIGSGGSNPNGTQGTAQGTTVSGGKYIANGVLVGVSQGLTANSTQAQVQVEITPNISVNSTFGTASGSGFGAKYSIDY